jgi:hypothetical protein
MDGKLLSTILFSAEHTPKRIPVIIPETQDPVFSSNLYSHDKLRTAYGRPAASNLKLVTFGKIYILIQDKPRGAEMYHQLTAANIGCEN